MHTVTSNEGNAYEILKGEDICDETLTDKTMGYFSRLMEIDCEVYNSAYSGDISGYVDRFGYRPLDNEDPTSPLVLNPEKGCIDNIIAVAKDDKIIGYINYLTANEELYDEIIHPDMEAYYDDPGRRDDGISGLQIDQWSKDNPNHLFILSIAIDKEHQDTDVIKVLTNEFRQELTNKINEGYEIESITGDTVSDHGEDALTMMRFTCAEEEGKPLILPAPEADDTEHDVTVRICTGQDLEDMINKGFDLDRTRVSEKEEETEMEIDDE